MRKTFRFLLLLGIIMLVASCASKPLPPPQYSYGKGAITFHLKSSPQLNLYQGSSHTLLICVYQLRDPNGFNQLSGDEDGLYKLLECAPFDGSVTYVKRLVVQPGQNVSFDLDRAEGTKYVGFVAGYSQLTKENIVRLFRIPVVVEKKGFIRTTKTQKPAPLQVQVVLGSYSIEETEVLESKK
ncbi:MAG: type VI secretion system lipoprotein TssJ [Deltaproteobacteria bacterium]|nr:MAG: type VI secretion system lipoprotein TssJ [Deltaproteobacteria bacterium]RLB86548.1 MAG: type VI secretion system lipoprotein TssJ [Deltaproteobacteria bacterium]